MQAPDLISESLPSPHVTPGCRRKPDLSALNQWTVLPCGPVCARVVAQRLTPHSGRGATTAAGHQRPWSCTASAARAVPARAFAPRSRSPATSPASAPGTACWATGSTPASVTHGGMDCGMLCHALPIHNATQCAVTCRWWAVARRLECRPVGHAELDREELLQLVDLGLDRDGDVVARQRRHRRFQGMAREHKTHLRRTSEGPWSPVWLRGGAALTLARCPKAEP